jgi:hypothetical protein
VWDDDVLPHFHRWCAWHTQLNDYLMAAHAEYRASGRPIMCAIALDDPDSPAAEALDQYWLGRDLLCAPVLEDGVRRRIVSVPFDGMIELWRAVDFDPVSRAHTVTGAGTGAVHDAGEVTLDAALDEVPMLVRPGAVLCLLSPVIDTLAPYGDSWVRAELVEDRVLLAFPSRPWSGSLGDGLSATSAVDDRGWVLEVEGFSDRRVTIQADLGLLPSGRPDQVQVLGATSHHYDSSTGVLRASLASDRLEVNISTRTGI